MAFTKVSCLWKSPRCAREYRTGVSLHGHTKHSKEKLQFIPAFTEKWPLLQRILDRQYRRSVVPVDFSRAYWTSPLTARNAFDVERGQIENVLGLAGLVSLTDHDSIQAPALLRMANDSADAPLSLEWSLPIGGTIFHLGVHNLPAIHAHDVEAQLHRYTANPSPRCATELLAMLASFPEVLVVFNHPLWDLCGLGPREHGRHLEAFLKQNNQFLHAFELNGMRTWDENRRVLPLAERWQQPLIAGGDRHASEPSATLNLTNATSFSEFVDEIRIDQHSQVLFMPQFTEPMCVRVAHAVLDVLRYYPEHPKGTRRWDDRVFHPDKTGEGFLPISAFWKAPPAFVDRIFSVFRLAENATVQWAARRVYGDEVDVHMLSDSPSEATP
ncbi:MAG: hypothetical protein ACYDC6_10415 [Acidobacteriaceae bacterium]